MTGSKEDYIKVIYELGGERNRISTKDIAHALEISAPSVSEMLRKLAEEGVLQYEIYKGVMLTEKGVKEAVRIKKVHILWEVFLVEKLGYDLADVHQEAELLEHITSKRLEEKLEEFLGYPDICPHGTPLNHDEYLFDYLPLSRIKTGEVVTLKRFKDDKKFLKEIKSLHLNLEDKLRIYAYNAKNRTYKVLVNEEEIEISADQASKIYVFKDNN